MKLQGQPCVFERKSIRRVLCACRLEDMDHLKSQYHMTMVQLDIETFSPDECVLCISVSARLGYWKDLVTVWSRLDVIAPQIRWVSETFS